LNSFQSALSCREVTFLPALARQLKILVGGVDETTYENVKGICSRFGTPVHIEEEYGKASSMKLVLNSQVLGVTAVFFNGLSLCQKSNLDSEKFMEILRPSPFFAKYDDFKYQNVVQDSYLPAHATTKTLLKDAQLIAETGEARGMDMTMWNGLVEQMRKAAEKYPAEDFAALFKIINK
jgi:3-hydroxyisobutyrate dehydrogenase